MASTFGALTFQTVRDGTTLSVDAAVAEVAETHIPGSNINILDIGGMRAARIQRRIKIDHANVASWRTARNTVATLTLVGVSYGSALLEQLTEHDEEIDLTCDYFTAQWVLTS